MTLLWKPAGRGNVRGLTPKSEKEENSEDKKSMTEETRSSLTASDDGSYHREWPSEPSNYEESIGVSRQNILRTEERGLLNVWTDFNRNSDSESPDDLIPNNILRAQTTRKLTTSVIYCNSMEYIVVPLFDLSGIVEQP